MQPSQVVTILSGRLGQRTGLDVQIAAELALAQDVCESTQPIPWFLLTKDHPLTTVVDEPAVALPADFLQEYEEGALWLYDSDSNSWKLLGKDEYGALKVQDEYLTPGRPSMYALRGDEFQLFPTPDKVYSMRLNYYAADVAPTVENKWLKNAPLWLIAKVGVAMAKFLRDRDAIQLFRDDEAEAYKNLLTRHVARQQAATAPSLGG